MCDISHTSGQRKLIEEKSQEALTLRATLRFATKTRLDLDLEAMSANDLSHAAAILREALNRMAALARASTQGSPPAFPQISTD